MPSASVVRAIWAAAREHGVDREGVHDAIFAGWRKTSVKDLTDREAGMLLDGIRGKSGSRGMSAARRDAMGKHGRKDSTPRNSEFLINDRERELLSEAAHARNWSAATLREFCMRQLGVAEPRTVGEYNKVFWAIKAMQRRDAKRGGHA